ncbi:MAG: serine hydroxymethyltransferase, partial [Planctomycetes bacterium]|nr:serine hydroxymethyltransferase [Planctomycetota bacterium]
MPTIEELITRERERQTHSINLIASENFVSDYVKNAMGTVFTNKYAEGYPGKRWYGGCEFTDQVEQHAIDLAKSLFNADHANVQPHSGTQANLASYLALIKPGDKVLAFKLEHGGHLSHGAKFNASGKYYKFVHYGVSQETGLIDLDEYTALLKEHGDIKLVVTGASSYPRAIDFERMAGIAREHGALFMADVAHISGLVAAGAHQSPVPVADVVTMSTHKTIRGPRGGMILSSAKWASKVDRGVFPGSQGGPLVHIMAAKAAMLEEASKPEFKQYIGQVIKNAQAMAKAFSEINAERYKVLTGGTDNHMVMVDITGTGKNGL